MQIKYFSWMRERLGKSEETLTLPGSVKTIAAVLDHLATLDATYAEVFENRTMVKTALNQTHAAHEQLVSDHDELAIFPPVTGG